MILNNVQLRRDEVLDDIVARTHIVVVYNGENTVASSSKIHNALPGKTKCTYGAKQQRASFQKPEPKKEIAQPTKRFVDHVDKSPCAYGRTAIHESVCHAWGLICISGGCPARGEPLAFE